MQEGSAKLPRIIFLGTFVFIKQNAGGLASVDLGDVQKLDGQVDPTSLHGGCKVLAGEKWSSTKWMRQRAFD